MRFQVSIETSDYDAFVTHVVKARGRHRSRKSRIRDVAIWISLVAIFVATFQYAGSRSGELTAPCFAIPFVFTAVFLTLFLLFLWDNQKKLRPSANGTILGRHDYDLGEDGIRVSSSHSESFLRWSGVRELLESDSHLFVMTDTAAGIIWPKRDIDSPSELDDVRTPGEERDRLERMSCSTRSKRPRR